ncbi:unnamed protein product [Ectocarpus sp. 4 AP-2014]
MFIFVLKQNSFMYRVQEYYGLTTLGPSVVAEGHIFAVIPPAQSSGQAKASVYLWGGASSGTPASSLVDPKRVGEGVLDYVPVGGRGAIGEIPLAPTCPVLSRFACCFVFRRRTFPFPLLETPLFVQWRDPPARNPPCG